MSVRLPRARTLQRLADPLSFPVFSQSSSSSRSSSKPTLSRRMYNRSSLTLRSLERSRRSTQEVSMTPSLCVSHLLRLTLSAEIDKYPSSPSYVSHATNPNSASETPARSSTPQHHATQPRHRQFRNSTRSHPSQARAACPVVA